MLLPIYDDACLNVCSKRLRNEGPASLEWVTPHVSEDRRCVDAVAHLLQVNQFESVPHCMDVAVHLVQGLKKLQLFNTPYARQSFDDLYGGVLDYVGKVIDQIKQIDAATRILDNSDDSTLEMFSGVYQYLIEVIARHTENLDKHSSVLQVHTDRELGLLTLPLAVEHLRAKGGVAANTGILLSPAASLLATLAGSTRLPVFEASAAASLVATLMTEDVYSDKYSPWLQAVYAWCLSKTATLKMRLAAWSMFPMFCHYMERRGKDGYAGVLDSARVTIDDPPQLLDLVASTVGYLACARAGCLRLKSIAPNKDIGLESVVACLLEDVSAKDRPSSDGQNSHSSAGKPIYCVVCDSADEQAGDGRKSPEAFSSAPKTVSLSDWLSYWFIASSRQNEPTSIQFLRGVCRFVRHAPPDDVGLKASPLGQGTVRRLTSSSREVRLAATDAVLAYSQASPLDSEKMAEIKRGNRAETMRTLTRLAQDIQEPSIIEETLQLVAGGVGCACDLQEGTLGVVLPFLVDYYCRDNIFLRAVAMEQLLYVSQDHGMSLAQLLSAFAGSISCTLASTLAQRSPRSFVHCMQILETTPKLFLQQHQDAILPHLVASGNEAALRNVAELLEVQLPVLCVNQAPVVFVKIFLMDDQLMHQAMLRFVRLISVGSGMDADQVEVNIPSLLRSCSVKLIFNLILSLGEDDGVLRRRARSALLTVQSILASASTDAKQGVSTIVQRSVDNLKDVSKGQSPRSGGDIQQQTLSSELADFLSQHILGVLAYVNELLRDSELASSGNKVAGVVAYHHQQRRRMVLRAIGELAMLLGPRSLPFAPNIVASLTPPLDGPLAAAALRAWEILAENLSHTMLSADQLNLLIVPLLTTFATCNEATRRGAASAINRVVKLHRPAVLQHFSRLCPIPDDPLLADSYGVMHRLKLRQELQDQTLHLTQLLKTKDSTVVMCAANELCSLIRQNESVFGKWKLKLCPGYSASLPTPENESAALRLESESNATLVVNTVQALKMACGVGGQLGEMAAASCAACLAAIGSIAGQAPSVAGREGLNSGGPTPKSPSVSFFDVHDEEQQMDMVFRLIIDHLSLAFASAPSPGVQTCAAYTIQELMRHVGFTKDLLYGGVEDVDSAPLTTARSGRRRRDVQKHRQLTAHEQWLCAMWSAMPPDVVEVIKPLLDTKYAIQQSNRPAADAQQPRTPCIWRSANHMSWLRTLVVELANALPSIPAYSVFKLCSSVVKEGSVDMLLFLLPQVAYQYCMLAAKDGRTAANVIVVNDDDDDVSIEDASTKDHESLKDASILGEEIRVVFSREADRVLMPADQWRMCKETALDLLDSLNNHLRKKQENRTSNKRGVRSDAVVANATSEEQAILSLVDSVPSQLVALAAFSCSQYERAMLHTELSLRSSLAGSFPTIFRNVNDAAVATMMELYFSMGDADGVAGAASCRKHMDLNLSVRKYEIEGNWSHALIGHESLLRSQPDSEEYQRGWISCLQKMGQWEGAWAASKELFRAEPSKDSERQLNTACFAAAWRLGKWDWVSSAIGEKEEQRQRTAVGSQDLLSSFDALNSTLLLRISGGDGGDMRGLDLLPRLRASMMPGHSITGGIPKCSIEDMCGLALRAVGRGIAETATFRKQALASSYVTASAPDAQNEIHAHMLGDISLLVKYLGGANNVDQTPGHLPSMLDCLAEQWRARVSYLPPVYSVQEPVLALHTQLYDIVLNRYISQVPESDARACTEIVMRQIVSTHLQAAQLARLAGFRATALGILTHAELTCAAKPALLAPLQIEHAQILWDEGYASDAMSAISRVADDLWAKLKSQYEDGGGGGGGGDVEGTLAGGTVPMSSSSQVNEAGGPSSLDVYDTKVAFAKAALYLSIWQEATNSVNSGALQQRYERIIRVHESDKAHYGFALFYDNMFKSLNNKDLSMGSKVQQETRILQVGSLQYYIVRYYSRSLVCSPRYLFQALPRLLTVWLDFGTTILQPLDVKTPRLVDRYKSCNRIMINMSRRLPSYHFLVVLSQLVSRICHSNDEVFAILESIILRVLEHYPQQTLWQLMGVQRSTYTARSERCNAVLAKARASQSAELKGVRGRSRNVGIGVLIQQASKLTDMLLGMCNAVPPARTVTTMRMSKDFKKLLNSAPLDIIVPLERCLVPTLPEAYGGIEYELALSARREDADTGSSTDGAKGTGLSALERAMLYQPFSSDLPTISSFGDEIEVISSLQRPKKIVMHGSDGRAYSFLCKPKDDLRKDARLMEFNSMINQLLRSNTQTQKRGLHIRTYAVVPLNEECGLIQWVDNTAGLRHIIMKLYKARGVQISVPQIKALLELTTPGPAVVFTESLLPLFPSVFHEWFLQSFPDPPRWLESRTNFTRSAAVMSMVGYILGLGDRHCENILVDENTGSVLHVDFNCLFEKGMTLEKPERVPFRLTHNMVDAMGVTGYEGTFRKTCEMTLSLLRENRDGLMSVLESFLHDPLVEWNKRATRGNRVVSVKEIAGGQPNEQASRCLLTIKRKLQGIVQGDLPMSVEGQVDELIREATDPVRLFSMYIGWAAYM
ncbi:hypothetical protein H4S03_001488 [Coemansia sp. S3946]|nr:hypothetical protein H4S03_001488 [Coemansia sp. S3946]